MARAEVRQPLLTCFLLSYSFYDPLSFTGEVRRQAREINALNIGPNSLCDLDDAKNCLLLPNASATRIPNLR
ncbi:uncharacterized protein SCHCODRAFT_02625652 [Schizophyllum commune H4-8]|uniref:uncharacterized protein n=1 Tax=Schizophyllum commune (strain H4-8 / FGSC 9210) TaxID=578458 RepID=UPI002160FF4D|nr:uncharacterized protein SCHCODRAFT_02625652 [Schizophyllum commune H4-8]KAI5892239.1 hypothetical protein SCHCODRAFT_02625652 [Schizophyllum commune H4-8]